MAKDDVLLGEEMGRLEIEPMKKFNKIRNEENPFHQKFQRRPYSKKTNVQNPKCSCLIHHKNIGICKKKQNKILKEPVLRVLKTCINDVCLLEGNGSSDSSLKKGFMSTSAEHSNIDPFNLCSLVQNCNQLKISSGLSKTVIDKNVNSKSKWWNKNVLLSSAKEVKEQRHSSQTGSCSQQALNPPCDITIDELASYFETFVHIPKKMSSMAEMMYI